jgi:hypothetical protein
MYKCSKSPAISAHPLFLNLVNIGLRCASLGCKAATSIRTNTPTNISASPQILVASNLSRRVSYNELRHRDSKKFFNLLAPLVPKVLRGRTLTRGSASFPIFHSNSLRHAERCAKVERTTNFNSKSELHNLQQLTTGANARRNEKNFKL